MTTIEVKPGDTIPNCRLLTGKVAGVRMPRLFRVYDVREHDETVIVKRRSSCGAFAITMYGAERAGFAEQTETSMLVSVSTYVDSRTAPQKELKRQLIAIRKELALLAWKYRKAKHAAAKRGPANGGSCVYLPLFAEIANFGWGVYAKRGAYVVQQFGA